MKKDRKNLIALNNLGEEMVRKGAFKVAEHLLDRAVAISPKFEFPYIVMAYSQIRQGQLAQAKTLLDKCISLNEKNPAVYVSLAIYYLKSGDAQNREIVLPELLS